ncbi:MAG TPA: TlpA disulfide reductase family protein [Thermoanaerobaculia bacterium]|nr:TlpA disulfide reductase family protein [Thermoanaerobaculia bacterium]
MNRKALLVGALVAVPLLAMLALGLGFDPRFVESPLVGAPAPSFRLMSLDGEVWDLEELRGTPVVLNFWSTWCPPCLEEHPLFMTAAQRYAGRVQFLGVVYQDDVEKIRTFSERWGAWGPALVDPDGEVAIAYGVFGPPETFFIDGGGQVVEKVIGAVRPDHLLAMLEGML